MEEINKQFKIIILEMGRVPYLDTAGEFNLSNGIKKYRKHGGIVIISELQDHPRHMLKKQD
ncbi:STAS domain-containing protein [Paenibacillus sp. CGMCC 1.16610]|uniref:STAS domain-containing protein n=1 Tax=Paenibacillus anseongense TaxID=2682845 RepID=A0ABW9UJS9_9BACL|nr:STAS domain-containing protein [Paenibacillus anseongense]MBA2939753.1 STAS domain-containing protein [Paenibacillus sp. CGMCC 1.16610]MVQ39413.1 STAS domain-containing protein [Paenibacillus anseongense]